MDNDLLTTDEAAALVGCDRATIIRRMQAGEFAPVNPRPRGLRRAPHPYRFRRGDILRAFDLQDDAPYKVVCESRVEYNAGEDTPGA